MHHAGEGEAFLKQESKEMVGFDQQKEWTSRAWTMKKQVKVKAYVWNGLVA